MKLRIWISIISFGLSFGLVQALVITEFNYNPEGTDSKREWIEIYNDTDVAVDLTTYGLLENDVNHGISYFKGATEISPDSYAIIAADAETFASENSGATNVYDSVFTLNNTGETFSIVDSEDRIISTVTYSNDQGADGEVVHTGATSTSAVKRRVKGSGRDMAKRKKAVDDAAAEIRAAVEDNVDASASNELVSYKFMSMRFELNVRYLCKS